MCGSFSKLRKYVLERSVNDLSTVYIGFIGMENGMLCWFLRIRD
jgi:hypothetical protein